MIPLLGHVLGLPVEETIAALLPAAAGLLIGVRVTVNRLLRRR